MRAHRSIRRHAMVAGALCVFLALPSVSHAQSGDKSVEKVLKALITSIRYDKDDLAAKQLSFSTMAERLMGPEWQSMSAAQKKELATGLETIVRTVSFKKGREMFEHLDAVLYDAPRVAKDKGVNEARCKSTVVVHRSYKKAEIVIDWVLIQDGAQWKVFDTVMLGESTIASLRQEQIEPLLKKGGVEAVLQALRTKLAELKGK